MDSLSVDSDFDMLEYGFHHTSGQSNPHAVRGERELWCSVILQAFIDIGCVSGVTAPGVKPQEQEVKPCERMLTELSRRRRISLHWLLYDMRDFPKVCSFAGVSPYVIRQAARRFVAIHHPSCV